MQIDRMLTEELGETTNDDEAMERDIVKERITTALSKFIKYGEQVTIEFDVEEGTAVVQEL